ncbi:uncharacterized protein LOC112539249 [Tetranychus urticae]|uniref:Uncharacterized protein n=1 Tax=Tetranychus urticae TaxID=32264 RepID=T1KP06_TETUR|nr:uncharacterized protein LOC112539249 [Tetranychus urticae]
MELNFKHNLLCTFVLLSILSLVYSPIESTTSVSSEVTYCTYSQACGWIVFDQDKPVMMIKNFCTCSEGHSCVKIYHERSNRADIYNCRSSIQAEGKERWPTNKLNISVTNSNGNISSGN